MLHDATPPGRAGQAIKRRKPLDVLEPVDPASRDRMLIDIFEVLDCPRALTAAILYRYGEHRQLVELTIDSTHYECTDLFRRSYCATKLLSKATGLSTGIDLQRVAIDSAMKAEERCSNTNTFLRMVRSGSVRTRLNEKLFLAQQKIATILGDVPTEFKDFGWTRGRTTAINGPLMSNVTKYGARLDVTVDARARALRMLRDSPSWGAAAIQADGPCTVMETSLCVAKGNVMFTVPKSAKTDRVICYEPHLNIRLQRNVGVYLQHRLKKFGVDLQDQSVNQRRAKLASLTGHLATIDLRSASDTLAFELVVDLLPPDWLELLDDLRSKYTLWPDGQWRQNEKFSSMGNGFTFELESLIFYALASTVCEGVSVYGDDIIVPSGSFEEVSDLLEGCGFWLNRAKSFAHGSFRESCGEDCFRGLSVTPVYVRSLPSVRSDVLKIHNQLRLWAGRSIPEARLERVLRKWRASHPCFLGPQGLGDGHYHVDFDVACPPRAHPSAGWEGWWYNSFVSLYQDHWWLGDDLEPGNFPADLGYAALCGALGPKAPRSLWDATSSRRRVKWRKIRAVASSWPSLIWV